MENNTDLKHNLNFRPRKPVKIACLPCRVSHIACETKRPCNQCLKRGKVCTDAPPKHSKSDSEKSKYSEYTNVIPDQFPAQVNGFGESSVNQLFGSFTYYPSQSSRDQDKEMQDVVQNSPQSEFIQYPSPTHEPQSPPNEKKLKKLQVWEIHPPYQPEDQKINHYNNCEQQQELIQKMAQESIFASPLLKKSNKLYASSVPSKKKSPSKHKFNHVRRSVTPPLLGSTMLPSVRRAHSQNLKISSKFSKPTTFITESSPSSSPQHSLTNSPVSHRKTTMNMFVSQGQTIPQSEKYEHPLPKQFENQKYQFENPPYSDDVEFPPFENQQLENQHQPFHENRIEQLENHIFENQQRYEPPFFNPQALPLIPPENEGETIEISTNFFREMTITINNITAERNHYLQQLDQAHQEIQVLQKLLQSRENAQHC